MPPLLALSIRLQKILLREKATTNNFGSIHSLGKVDSIMEFSDQDAKLKYRVDHRYFDSSETKAILPGL